MKQLVFLTCLLVLACGHVAAQDTTIPEVRTSLQNGTAIPGQPLLYRVTVLVPTWLPSPPEFPSYEAPNVIVRLPSRASGPASETIGGETWSGVTRSYRLYPMVEGTFQIPAGTIKVTYADPDTQDPVAVEAKTDSFEITGKRPPGTETLDPFLAATSVALNRSVDGTPQEMQIGDALTLTTVVKVAGVSPMFVPSIEQETKDNGLAFYPKEPRLEEKEDRGLLSGTRTEETDIVAEASGTFTIPGQQLSWYNLKSGKVENAVTPEIAIKVVGVTATSPPQDGAPIDWPRLIGSVVGLILFGFAGVLLWRRHSPSAKAHVTELIHRYRASEMYLHKRLVAAIRSRDLNLVMQQAPAWQREIGRQCRTVDWSEYDRAIHRCGAGTYSLKADQNFEEQQEVWDDLMTVMKTIRKHSLNLKRASKDNKLPQLNPQ